ncbi:MAG TPA: glycerophosphodiester phosphodiesterase [Ilumatobacter sp.]|nr:glycerophosphodiester phosphodiesterase [Ilumatobacter sp.]
MQQRLPSLLDSPILFAHRGARAYARENTIEAFQLGLWLGASGLESDVWLTADGEVVLDHDGVVRRGLRNRPISGFRRAELPAHIPTIGELVEACGTDYHLSLDLKDPACGPAVIAAVREAAPGLIPKLWLCSPTLSLLETLRALDADVRLVDSTRLDKIKEGPERRAAYLANAGIDGINMHHTCWNGGLVALFHRFERTAFAWDVQFEHVLQPVLRMGIDAVYSDWPDRMVDVAASVSSSS